MENIFNVFSDALRGAFPLSGEMCDRDFVEIANVMHTLRGKINTDEWQRLIRDRDGMTDVIYAICGYNCDILTEYPKAGEALSEIYVTLRAQEQQLAAEEDDDLMRDCEDAVASIEEDVISAATLFDAMKVVQGRVELTGSADVCEVAYLISGYESEINEKDAAEILSALRR